MPGERERGNRFSLRQVEKKSKEHTNSKQQQQVGVMKCMQCWTILYTKISLNIQLIILPVVCMVNKFHQK